MGPDSQCWMETQTNELPPNRMSNLLSYSVLFFAFFMDSFLEIGVKTQNLKCSAKKKQSNVNQSNHMGRRR